jgi:nitrate reductase delta subunit
MLCPNDREIYRLFADILEYPTPALVERVQACLGQLAPAYPEAADELKAFGGFVEQTPLEKLEELYTHTFDLQVVCYPYVGYQLFGESYKRGAFLAGLRPQYRTYGFSDGNELSDHIAVTLRFPAVPPDEEIGGPLLEEALIPALTKMLRSFKDEHHPYRRVLRALLLMVQGPPASEGPLEPCAMQEGRDEG